MKLLRRIYLFARDYLDELPLVWSLARTRDCERNGGHRWAVSAWSINGQVTRECARCGCSDMIQTTTSTGNNFTWTLSGR